MNLDKLNKEIIKLTNKKDIKDKFLIDFRDKVKNLLKSSFNEIKNTDNNLSSIPNKETKKENLYYYKKITYDQAIVLCKKTSIYLDGSLNRKNSIKVWRKYYPKIRRYQIIEMLNWITIDENTYKVNFKSTINNWKHKGFINE